MITERISKIDRPVPPGEGGRAGPLGRGRYGTGDGRPGRARCHHLHVHVTSMSQVSCFRTFQEPAKRTFQWIQHNIASCGLRIWWVMMICCVTMPLSEHEREKNPDGPSPTRFSCAAGRCSCAKRPSEKNLHHLAQQDTNPIRMRDGDGLVVKQFTLINYC